MSEKEETGTDLELPVETTISEQQESEPPETMENLKNQIAELKKALGEKDKQLQEKEKLTQSNMKMIENAAEQYKAQIKSLKSMRGCSDDKQLAKEYDRLQKLNSTLLNTNASLNKEVEKLKAELTAVESASSDHFEEKKDTGNSQSVGFDAAAVKAALEETSRELTQVKDFAHQQQLTIAKLNKEKNLLIQDLVKSKKLVKDHKDKLSELTGHMQIVVAERDKLVSQSQGGTTHVEHQSTDVNNSAAEIENMRNQIVHLLKENKQQKIQLSNNDDHIKEQEAKIEKLVIRCTQAEAETNSPNSSPTKAGVISPEAVKCMQSLLDKRYEEINELKTLNSFYAQQSGELEKENKRLNSEMEQLRSQSSPDVIAVQEQFKAFQDDFFNEREEKKRIIEQSKLLEEENMRLRASRQQSNDSLHLSPPPVSQSSLTAQSPPTQSQPFKFGPPQHPRMPVGQGVIPHTNQSVYQASYRHPNAIPPGGSDYSQSQGHYDHRHPGQYAHGAFYGYPPEQRGQYYSGPPPEMPQGPNYPHPPGNSGPNGRPRAPNQGQQHRSQLPRRK